MAQKGLVQWSDDYSVGVGLIDDQHKGLIKLTNELAEGCRKSGDEVEIYFMRAVQGAVKYVKTHFTTEEIIMERLNYPEFLPHKKEHEDFVQEVLLKVKEFEGGQKLAPQSFVEYLQDWVLNHIAKSDKKYAFFFDELRKQGKLDESMFKVDVANI